MLAFILLRGKEFALPDSISSAIIGLFFGLLCGLFYYQHYPKAYYWWFSLVGGVVLTFAAHTFLRIVPGSDSGSLEITLATFILPFILTLGLNHYFYILKKRKRRRRLRRKVHSTFFDSVDASTILHNDSPKTASK